MWRTVGLLGASLLLVAAAPSPPPSLQKAFTGTIVSTYPDGRIAKLWMKPSGEFTSEGRRHDRSRGRWSVSGDKVCFKRGLLGYCTTLPTGPGSFTTKAVTGETIQVRLEPGRKGETPG